jgi:hypothetical protein
VLRYLIYECGVANIDYLWEFETINIIMNFFHDPPPMLTMEEGEFNLSLFVGHASSS